MIYCHLGRTKSLREISYGLQSCLGKINHLGLRQAPKKSTLSYANKNRSLKPFEELFYNMLESCQSRTKFKKKFSFKHKLFSLNVAIIELCANMFDWAKYRKTKGAVKLHLKWDNSGIFFVTRIKSNAKYTVIENRKIPSSHRNIVSDQLIKLDKNGLILRKITIWVEEKQQYMELLSNHMTLSAKTISAIYKDRWAIEQFFKTIKQHLRIKTFIGTSANAIHIQIWIALICILLVKYLQYLSSASISLSNFVYILSQNLFVYRNLTDWLINPFASPPTESEYEQPNLPNFDFRTA